MKSCTHSTVGGGPQVAAMRLHYRTPDGQPHPTSLRLGGKERRNNLINIFSLRSMSRKTTGLGAQQLAEVSRTRRKPLMLGTIACLALVFVMAFVISLPAESQPSSVAGGTASDGPGDAASWTTGNKVAVGTSADTTSKVWFTVAKGVTTEIFYPRLDVPNMQDMQYIVTDGSTFVDLERDATNHVISMPDEIALEYTITNTDKRATPKYRITNTYITDPSQNTLLIRTRFQSLDGGTYRLYLLANPSMAGGGANDNAWWDGTHAALMASGTENLFGSPTTVVSALKVAAPNDFIEHDNGYAGRASDCLVDLKNHLALNNQFD